MYFLLCGITTQCTLGAIWWSPRAQGGSPYPHSTPAKYSYGFCFGYLNDLFRLIISWVKGILDCSLKTKSALRASINMMTTLPNFGGRGCPVPSNDGSGGRFSFVARPCMAFFSGKKPLRNSIKPTIWQNKRRTIKTLWPKDIFDLYANKSVLLHLKIANKPAYL